MSFAKNTISNYCARIYIILINLSILPLYLQYLGAPAFALISLYAVMQSWLSLFDMGLIPTLSREVAFYHSQENGRFKIKQLLRSLEIIFFFINLIIMLSVALSSHWIAHHWLKVNNLPLSEVSYCISLIGIMISCQFFSDLYRAGISGVEQQAWLNSVGVFLTTLQYGGAYILLRWITRIPSHFFEYQLLISTIEPVFLAMKFYKIFPLTAKLDFGFKISWGIIKEISPFAGSFFYVSTIWVLLTQSDKLILSHILPLTTYGYFALVTIISGGILQFASPISLALLPKMTRLLSQGKNTEMLLLYRQTTQIIAVIMLPISGIVAIFGTEIVYIWTGSHIAANWAGPILFWYALGNGIISLSAFQYYLQFAHGNLKLHVIFNTVFALISFPLILFSAYHYGALGTAKTWFFMQLIAFLVWPPFVHYKYASGLHNEWILNDIFPTFLVVFSSLICMKKIPVHFELMGRYEGFILLCGLTMLMLIISVSSSSTCRHFFAGFFQGRKGLKV